MDTKHTPESWTQEGLAIYANVDGRKTMVCQLGVSCDRWVKPETSVANARRIVACVNACKGMTTNTLELMAVGPDVKEIFDEHGELWTERDNLKKLVKAYMDTASPDVVADSHARQELIKLRDKARTAIQEGRKDE